MVQVHQSLLALSQAVMNAGPEAMASWPPLLAAVLVNIPPPSLVSGLGSQGQPHAPNQAQVQEPTAASVHVEPPTNAASQSDTAPSNVPSPAAGKNAVLSKPSASLISPVARTTTSNSKEPVPVYPYPCDSISLESYDGLAFNTIATDCISLPSVQMCGWATSCTCDLQRGLPYFIARCGM